MMSQLIGRCFPAGVNVVTNCVRSDNSKQMDIPVTLNQVMSLANETSNVYTKNLVSECSNTCSICSY